MRRFLCSGLAIALAAAPLDAQASEVTQAKIDAAIDHGVAHLLDQYQDGEGRDPHVPPGSPLNLVNRPGLRALTLYTLLKCGVSTRSEVVEKLVARLSFERFENTYDVACMLLALDALDPVGQRAWIEELAAFLIEHRERSGEYGYPGGGDLSNTQFAALGLRAAVHAGVNVPADLWSALARAVFRHQCKDGGFSYTPGDGHPTDTMSAAGVGVLAVCETELALDGALEDELAQQIRRARADGLAWIANELAVGRDADHNAWQHYFLYGLERVGGLCGLDRIGDHDWYREGAAHLVDTQDGHGEWHGSFDRAPTLFALLFLARATGSVATGARSSPATGPAPRMLVHTPGSDIEGGIRLEARGTHPVRMWLTRLVSPADAPFEWPGERGRGPHVALVEFLSDGVPIEVVLGDPERPARDQLFACEHRALPRGHHRLAARVHVRPPEARGDGEARDRPSAPADHVITTNGVEIDVDDDAGATAAAEPAFDPDLDVLQKAKPKASVSSTIAKAPGGDALMFAARQSVDGNPRSPWIAAIDDEHPLLRVQLSEPQRANLVRIAPARLVPRNPDYVTLPREISVAVDGGAPRTLEVGDGSRAWFDLKLDRPMLVHSLEIRLVGRAVQGSCVGIGEVVLQLTAG